MIEKILIYSVLFKSSEFLTNIYNMQLISNKGNEFGYYFRYSNVFQFDLGFASGIWKTLFSTFVVVLSL